MHGGIYRCTGIYFFKSAVFINIHYDRWFLPVFSRSLSHPEGGCLSNV